MIKLFRNSGIVKKLSLTLVFGMVQQMLFPIYTYALTGGPSQPEVQSFAPVETSEMVDLFSGDFNYNIPLLDVGGYPVNLSYNSNITMDQEASWVGLGWNINPGVINRDMRSLPDDFKGDPVTHEFNMKDNVTTGISALENPEIFGKKLSKNFSLTFQLGVYYNSYTGMGVQAGIIPVYNITQINSRDLNFSLGIMSDSEEGSGIHPRLSLDGSRGKSIANIYGFKSGLNLGLSFSSRHGLKSLTLSGSIAQSGKKGKPASTKWGSSSATLSFAYPSYTPQLEFPFRSRNIAYEATIGYAIKGFHPNTTFQGYTSTQTVATNTTVSNAYGYMYLGEAYRSRDAMLDFNREKDGPFTPHTPNLGLASLNYDVFSLSAQGTGGSYRLHRGDIGTVYDAEVSSYSVGTELPGVEFGGSSDTHFGTDLSVTEVESVSRLWGGEDANDASYVLWNYAFTPNTDFEPAYFKRTEDIVVDPETALFDKWWGTKAARFTLGNDGDKQWAESKLTDGIDPLNNATQLSSSDNKRTKRVPRNQPLSSLNNLEASRSALIKPIQNCTTFTMTNGVYGKEEISRLSLPLHHISQITSTSEDGSRYIYGIPAYNTYQKEVTFAIDADNYFANVNTGERISYARTGICNGGYLTYPNANIDDISTDNNNGADHFFDATSIGAYAHSYLLTAIVSPDYVDVTGDGPSDDDLGTYTRFNYTRTNAKYKWRVPYANASYNPGLLSKFGEYCDDKGNIIYGEKEIWYLHSIVTKTHIAEFKLENRYDSWDVENLKEGGLPDSKNLSNTPSKRLKEIVLYAKHDRIYNTTPTPLKVVHFEYDYSLCKGIPNYYDGITPVQPGGKLTLKKIYFTYGNITKGELSPYEFTYAESFTIDPNIYSSAIPYNYDIKGYDRWGNFNPNYPTSNSAANALLVPFPVQEYPYVNQKRGITDLFSRAWKLEKIALPSGGEINVSYEADDYAYVQNKRAMQMTHIDRSTSVPDDNWNHDDIMQWLAGVSSTAYLNDYGKELYSTTSTARNILFFELDEPINAAEYSNNSTKFEQEFRKKYILDENGNPIKDMYFKFHIELYNQAPQSHIQEYIPGYAELTDAGICPIPFGSSPDALIKYGWLRIKNENIPDKIPKSPQTCNPISLASWNFMKMNYPQIAYGKPAKEEKDLIQFFDKLISTIADLVPIQKGMCSRLREHESARLFFANSMVRLYQPTNKKLGGGARVKEIRISDKWEGESGNGYEYGQTYDYTKIENEKEISSGIATYEPMIGADENPFRMPIYHSEQKPLAPDDRFMHETPYGEMFFPGASVGYSQVTVKNLNHVGVKRHATGSTVHKYYTAKDFPTITSATNIASDRYKTNPLLALTNIESKDYQAVSQGYCIELNDMHGKPKGEYHYNEAGELITKTVYRYKTKDNHPSQLSSTVQTIDRSGTISNVTLGLDYDIVGDLRENKTETTSRGTANNLEMIVAAAVTLPIPIFWPVAIKEKTRFRSAVLTKVILRHGLLDEVTAYDQGSSITTKNVLYDQLTGSVLLTRTTNDFKDPVYSLTIPAHWAYQRMGQVYHNQDLVLTGAEAKLHPTNYFIEGDEVSVEKFSIKNPYRKQTSGWVTQVSPLVVSDRDGKKLKIPDVAQLKITRSGRRNMQNMPIAKIVMLDNPVQGNKLVFNRVIDAMAVEYSDDWGLFCSECGYYPDKVFNPFVAGTKGNWRLKRNYAYLTGRDQSSKNKNTNTRSDGVYEYFASFWQTNGSGYWVPVKDGWTFVSEVTVYSPYGVELENRDALNRYSSALYGYNFTLPVAVGQNAQYAEIAFDAFEDYQYDKTCSEHFGYGKTNYKAGSYLSNSVSHSGKQSMKLSGQNSYISTTKNLKKCK
ncbi:MAG: hypothetical protein K1X81_01625 [Bacteroidia bacterium]|nr:hypothetical protein [Bacteroidia bacterium]